LLSGDSFSGDSCFGEKPDARKETVTQTYKTDSGYDVEFPNGLEGKELSTPGRFHDCIAIPFVITGEPGLLDVRFRLHKQGDVRQDEYHEVFSSVLRPAGMATNFTGRRSELKGELTVPKRYLPLELLGVKIRNLSNV